MNKEKTKLISIKQIGVEGHAVQWGRDEEGDSYGDYKNSGSSYELNPLWKITYSVEGKRKYKLYEAPYLFHLMSFLQDKLGIKGIKKEEDLAKFM